MLKQLGSSLTFLISLVRRKEVSMKQFSIQEAVDLLVAAATEPGRNLFMPGHGKYQPKDLRPYLGYDQEVGWQIIAEWGWLHSLAINEKMPSASAELLTNELLGSLLRNITSTQVAELERKVGHDIRALVLLMQEHLPEPLRRWVHWCQTSYDPISSGYAIQAKQTFDRVFYPKCQKISAMWREHIDKYAGTLQMGRTHLQDASPITAGAWLAVLHHRFANNARRARISAGEIHGKFSGAVGLRNVLTALAKELPLEETVLRILGLPSPEIATQIPLPEGLERYYHDLTLISAGLANFGEDVRHLQSSAIEEVRSASSTSSTMSHKTANPVTAENMAGMHVSVRTAYLAVLETVNSDMQRDLRYSNVMRSYPEVTVFTYQQLLTAERLLASFAVDGEKCEMNFWKNGRFVVAELLHLALQEQGYAGAHELLNQVIVPMARAVRKDLVDTMDEYVAEESHEDVRMFWDQVSEETRHLIAHPERYLGEAVKAARAEVLNGL